MSLIFRFRKLHCRRFFSFRSSAVALIFCLSACANLAAQQAEADHPGPAALVATTVDAPAPEPGLQADAVPPQSSSDSGSAPQTQPVKNSLGYASGQQTKRILGIMPNFRAVSVDAKLPPETIKEKFIDATQDSFDYSSIFFPAVIAAYNMDKRATPEFHQGAAGFARYFWHSAVDQTSENYMVEFIFPTFTHEDARYYTLGRGGFVKRTGYALSRAVVTRSNSGAEVFNISEILGAGTAAGISNLYYPSASRSLGNTGSEWGLDIGIDAGCFWFREFWPDINRHFFHNKYGNASAR
ncbi:MAG: hypothetical protein ABR990_04280 [Terracidiphilus sp.]|jgi:hypothetical protein